MRDPELDARATCRDTGVMLVDSHCHIDLPAFDADRGAVLQRAHEAGVNDMIVPAVAADGWAKLAELCAQNTGLHAAYGLHPCFLDQHRPEDAAGLRSRLDAGAAVGVGECGLDFAQGRDHEAEQHARLRMQLALAREFDLPVIVHARRAVEAVILELRAFPGLRGVVHSFSGSQQQAEQLWAMGFALGIGGPVTHERARRLRRLVASMPLEYLLLETDSPDQSPATHRGQRNEPANLVEVAGCVADLRRASMTDIAAATTANAQRLFRLDATAVPSPESQVPSPGS